MRAWIELDSTRSIGMNVGPIPWDAIEIYCNSMDLTGHSRERMHHLIRAMDRVYLDFQRKRS